MSRRIFVDFDFQSASNVVNLPTPSTAGTVIPSVQWSATLTSGTFTWEPNNHMIITPLATSSTANFTGGFA